jgi:hypothetical protein
MSTAAVPSVQELQEELERESVKRPLYNPSNRWIDGHYNSLSVRLCPDAEVLNIRTGRVETTDGVTLVADIWGKEWAKDDETGKVVQTGNRKLEATSLDIVKHMMKTYGPMGLVRLTGDPKKDEAIKSEAKKRWVNHRLKWAAEVIEGRDVYLREFRAAPSNAGMTPDPPNELETEAIEFMDAYKIGQIGRKNFVCKDDGYQTDDERKWAIHQRARHPASLVSEDKEKADEKKGRRG